MTKADKNVALAAIIAEFSKTDERIRSAIKYVKEQGLTLSPNMAYSI